MEGLSFEGLDFDGLNLEGLWPLVWRPKLLEGVEGPALGVEDRSREWEVGRFGGFVPLGAMEEVFWKRGCMAIPAYSSNC